MSLPKCCAYREKVQHPEGVLFSEVHRKFILISEVRGAQQSDAREEDSEDYFDNQNAKENDGIAAVLHQDVSVDYWVGEDILLVPRYRIEGLGVERNGGSDVQADHESLRVVRVAVTTKQNQQTLQSMLLASCLLMW